jgi:biopolymer transport protein ExbD
MCSFKFKELEGRFEAWLPKDLGNGPMLSDPPPEIRVALTWDGEKQRTVRRFGERTVSSDAELSALLSGVHRDYVVMGRNAVPVTVDGDENVPWDQVVSVMDMAKRLGIDRVELARGPALIPK